MSRGSPGDAQHALQMGTEAGAFTGSRSAEAQKLLAQANKAAASDQTSLPRVEQEANASASGMNNAATGLAYLGYQQYDKAAEQLAKAVSKGGLKNEAEVRLNLGIAQLKAGHKDDAVKTFQSVHGSPVMERLASLWVIHAKRT
jgi:tetratricopeptide (TPR) repeat protein